MNQFPIDKSYESDSPEIEAGKLMLRTLAELEPGDQMNVLAIVAYRIAVDNNIVHTELIVGNYTFILTSAEGKPC